MKALELVNCGDVLTVRVGDGIDRRYTQIEAYWDGDADVHYSTPDDV